MIQLFRPSVTAGDARAVARALLSRWLGPGPRVRAFEAALQGIVGAPVLTLACATDALFLAMELLGVQRGDEVVVPDIHFIGAASAVLARGARVVPCDVDPQTLNATAETVGKVLSRRTKAIMALDYGGRLCDDEIFGLGVPVVEDAALALGTPRAGIRGAVGLWSFDAMKTITTAGSGGAIYVQAGTQRAARLTRLGVSSQHGLASSARRWWEYDLEEPGRLSELSDVQAAMGLTQLARLPKMLARRREICQLYDGLLPASVRTCAWGESPAFYWIQTEKRDALARHLKSIGIYTSFKYWPLHRALGIRGGYPGAEHAAARTLLLPLHCELRDRDVRRICREIGGFLHE